MRITSKSGTEITFEISGTQEYPTITAEKFTKEIQEGNHEKGDTAFCNWYVEDYTGEVAV